MDDKNFAGLLKALGKDKKAEDEAAPEIPAPEIKARKAHVGKTFYDRWVKLGDG